MSGLFQVLEAAAVSGQMYVLGLFVGARNPAATAANILANESLFQLDCMPRIIGALVFVCGLGWMFYLFPPLARQMFPEEGWSSVLALA